MIDPHSKSDLVQVMRIFVLLSVSVFLVVPAASPVDSASFQEGEALLKTLAGYRYGENADILLRLREYVNACRVDPRTRRECARRLTSFLETEATPAAKMEVCRQLRIIGDDNSVPVLERMLLKPEASEMARYALEMIPGETAEAALIRGLSLSRGRIRMGIISTLGNRRAAGAVPELAALLVKPDTDTQLAAVAALGMVADLRAAEALSPVFENGDERIRALAAASLLRCAGALAAADQAVRAGEIYDRILESHVSLSLQRAALKGKISAQGIRARPLILELLKSPDKGLHRPAIAMIPEIFDERSSADLCPLMTTLSASGQIQLLAALSKFPIPETRDTALRSLRSQDGSVRAEALRALQTLGDTTTVKTLIDHAAGSGGEERLLARESLWNLKGAAVDDTVLRIFSQSTNPLHLSELILCVRERGIAAGLARLMELAGSADASCRLEAIEALRVIARPADLLGLLDLLLEMKGAEARREMILTVARVARMIDRSAGPGKLVAERLSRVKDTRGRIALFRVLGHIGDSGTLPLLRIGLENSDEKILNAAVRALADWPDPTPRDDVLRIAGSAASPTHRVLALRAYIRMIGMDTFAAPEEAVALLATGLSLAERPQEKTAILGMLPQFPCQEGLDVIEPFIQHETVGAEARAAAKQILAVLEKKDMVS